MIEMFVSLGHSLIEASWTAATIGVKYYLAFTAVRLGMDERLSFDAFGEKLLEESVSVVAAFFAFGALILAAGMESEPFLKFFSELTALVYLGFLFWKV